MRSHDFSRNDYIRTTTKHVETLPDGTECPTVKYTTPTHHPPHLLTLNPVYDMHCPKSERTVLLNFCLFHDEAIEHTVLNLYKHPGYKTPR